MKKNRKMIAMVLMSVGLVAMIGCNTGTLAEVGIVDDHSEEGLQSLWDAILR